MAYTEINSRRMPYDVDGTAVGYNTTMNYLTPPTGWFSSSDLGIMNDDKNDTTWVTLGAWNYHQRVYFFFFPERREIEAISAFCRYVPQAYGSIDEVQGSNDTTDGINGTWETATFPSGGPCLASQDDSAIAWRNNIYPVSFSTSYKVLRMKVNMYSPSNGDSLYFKYLHLYGRKAAGENPDDILFCDVGGDEKLALMDWSDRPEGTTKIDSFKLKNSSTTKIANNINLQLNHADFALSWSADGPWTATLDITSIAANSYSAIVYVRNLLGEPPLVLGPRAARCIVTVGSWT